MGSISATGHAVNVANFKTLTTTCTYFGLPYNPVNAALKLTALNTLAAQADAVLNDLKNALPAFQMAVDLREAAFAPLSALVTRLVNAYETMGGDAALLAAVKALAKKITGQRATAKPKPSATDAEPSAKTVSASQMDYDSRWNNFDALVKTLQGDAAYLPNEADLKLPALQALVTTLQSRNSAVDNAYQPVSLARTQRNTVLYHPTTGLVAVAALVKKYVKSVYGAQSPQFEQVSGIKFTKFKP